MAAQGTALVIEDDDDIRHLLEVVLRQNGFDVEYAATGRDGVTAVLAGNFDLITVDLGLPDIDGVDVVREIRTRAQGKIVVISARAMEKYRTLSLEAGADAFVTKPFRPRELRATLTEILAA